jgi:hypothetical protein
MNADTTPTGALLEREARDHLPRLEPPPSQPGGGPDATGPAVVSLTEFVAALFSDAERCGIRSCVLRDAHRLDEIAGGGELDVLVAPADREHLERLLHDRGFARLPGWGHAPHRFFVLYQPACDAWLKLDVVTEIAFGRPVHNLRTDLGARVLDGRRRVGPVFAPSAEHELVTVLLHGVLDKGTFDEARRRRVQELRHAVRDEREVSAILREYWGEDTSWAALAQGIDEGRWDSLLGARPRVAAHLSSREPVGTRVRAVRDRLLRKARRAIGFLRPTAPSVALLAPDGAGKSTVVAALERTTVCSVRGVYMGLYQEGARRRPSRVPGIGLARLLCRQWRRYLGARLHQASGRLVLFDRYTYDALLPPRRRPGWSGRLRRWILGHACPAPALVVLLDAPAAVLHARKQEHGMEELERQRAAYLAVRSRVPGLAVIDASADAEQVRRQVTLLLWHEYRRRLLGRPAATAAALAAPKEWR